jgi:hypothetical protein
MVVMTELKACPFYVCYCIPLHHLWHMSASAECFPLCMAITASICVNRMARQLQDNIANYEGGGNLIARGRCEEPQSV